jgi:hypothetical protein
MAMKSAEECMRASGTKPADLPVEQPTRINLSVNLARKDD